MMSDCNKKSSNPNVPWDVVTDICMEFKPEKIESGFKEILDYILKYTKDEELK